MNRAVVPAHAKVNLFLAIRGRRDDGFHDLDMVNVEAGLADSLTFEDRAEPGIEITCDDPSVPTDSRNLVWRATALLVGESPDPGISIRLGKSIPVGSGLGGGSSDAAATLRTVNRLRRCARDESLPELAAQIGSDVPFSLAGGLCRCRGRGEDLEQIQLPNRTESWLSALLVLPDLKVRTTEAYRWWDTRDEADAASPDALIDAIRSRDPEAVSAALHNSFDSVVPRFVPALGRIRDAVTAKTAREPRLSGSGSSLFLVGGSSKELEEIRDKFLHDRELEDTRFEVTPLLV